MKKSLIGIILILFVFTQYLYADKSSIDLDDVMDMVVSDNNMDHAMGLGYLMGLYDAIKINENISETVYGLESRKFCFVSEPPKLVPDLVKMMNEYRQDGSYWNRNDPSYEVLINDSAYVMVWTLISNFQCEHNIKSN